MVKKVLKGFLISILTLAIVSIGLYLFVAFKYDGDFSYGTNINGVYCTDSSIAEINSQLLALTDKYRGITVYDKDGNDYFISADEVNLTYDYTKKLEEYSNSHSKFGWGMNFLGENPDHTILPDISYNTVLLQQKVGELPVWMDEIPDDQRELCIKKGEEGYYLVNERDNILRKDKATELILAGFENKVPTINLKDEGCYEDLPRTPEMLEAIKLIDKLDEFQTTYISYKIGDEIIPISPKIACEFAKTDEHGNIVFDESGNIVTDEEKVYAFVDSLAEKYDTVGKNRVFRTTAGRVVNVSGGNYGNIIDAEYEKEHLLEAFNSKKSEVHIPQFKQFCGVYGTDDIGSTYVEIDMSNQHLYYYEDGVLKVDSDIVTGNLRLGHGTPTGLYYVNNKARNTVLTGADYVSHVKYWIAFIGHSIGIHDASWRYGKFGGDIYKTNGSHGCVNTRTEEVGKLYELIQIGTPVLVFY